MNDLYQQTLVPDSLWTRLSPTSRNNLISGVWLVTLYLLPWNRTQPLTARLFLYTFIQAPLPGRFEVLPATAGTDALKSAQS